jgi:hypothetical protein
LLVSLPFLQLDDEDDDNEDDTDVLSVQDSSDEDDDMVEKDMESKPKWNPPASISVGIASPCIVDSVGDWSPLFIKGKFQDKAMAWHQWVVVLLPGGVGHKMSQDIALHLEYLPHGQPVLAIGIEWPQWIAKEQFISFLEDSVYKEQEFQWQHLSPSDQTKLERKFCTDFVLLTQEIHKQLVSLCSNPKSPVIRATAKIKLDMPVKPSIAAEDWHFVGSDQGT